MPIEWEQKFENVDADLLKQIGIGIERDRCQHRVLGFGIRASLTSPIGENYLYCVGCGAEENLPPEKEYEYEIDYAVYVHKSGYQGEGLIADLIRRLIYEDRGMEWAQTSGDPGQ